MRPAQIRRFSAVAAAYLLIIWLPLNALAETPSCDALFAPTRMTSLSPEDVAIGFKYALSSTLQKYFTNPLSLGGEIYQTLGRLGAKSIKASSSDVRLAVNRKGQKVVIKQTRTEVPDEIRRKLDWETLSQYIPGHSLKLEVMATEFYLEHGIQVPHIIAYDRINHILVKEYFPGLIESDLAIYKKDIIGDNEHYQKVLAKGQEFKAHVAQVRKGFEAWLRLRYPELDERFYFNAGQVIRNGDFENPNIIYNPITETWYLIDT